MADQWEYWTGIFAANIDQSGVREYLKKRWPDWKPAKYIPQCMIPALNSFGEQGWELVHMEPIAELGKNGDILFPNTDIPHWSHDYFCVFKRKIENN